MTGSSTKTAGRTRPVIVYFHRYPIEIEAYQYAAARPLIDRLLERYEVAYVSMKGRRPPDPVLRRGLRIVELPPTVSQSSSADKWFKTLLYYLLFPFTLKKLKALHPALIICKETLPFVPTWLGSLRVPVVISEVSDWWWSILLGGAAWGRALANRLERFEVCRWNRIPACAVVVNTRAGAGILERRGLSPERIRIINTPKPPGVYGPCDADRERTALGFGPGTWVAATHGIIRPGKGYGQMLEWWKSLAEQHPNWRLLIIGGAGGERWCRARIRRLNLDRRVVMTGWLATQNDVNRHLNAADCLLVIRRNSADNQAVIPSALYHSMATGKPTIATGLPGIAEIIEHGKNGYLFEPDRFDSFRAVLEYVASHPEEAARAGQAGIQRCRECFDPDRTAARHVDLIGELLRNDAFKGSVGNTRQTAP